MKETIDSKILWSEASKTGLVLGGVSILYTLISSMMGGAESGLVAGVLFALGTLLWIIKFAVCLFLPVPICSPAGLFGFHPSPFRGGASRKKEVKLCVRLFYADACFLAS